MMTRLKTSISTARASVAALALMLAPSALGQEAQPYQHSNPDSAMRMGAYDQALELYQPLCAEGDGRACYQIGQIHRQGLGKPQDMAAADTAYQAACDAGFAAGCTLLGNLLFEGRGLDEDVTRARDLYQTACERGEMAACGTLGTMTYIGLGGPRERVEGAELLRRSCNAEVAYACSQIDRLGIRHGEPKSFSPW